MRSGDENLFLDDEALSSEEGDEFGHKEYADSLERILWNADPPWHIGIFGEWGSGKTSIIRMLFNRLREKKEFEDTTFVEFDAWSHAEGSIRTELLLELDNKIGKEVGGSGSDGVLGEDEITGRLYDVQEEEDVSKPANPKEIIVNFWKDSPILAIAFVAIAIGAGILQYGGYSTLASVAVTGLLLPVLGYILQQLDTVARTIQRKFLHPRKEWSGAYQRIFNDIIENSDAETIVISIDNLDRCESSTVYEVLVSLKTFMENDNCIYLIPCDDKALESHIKSIDKGEYFNEERNEREFLRKFFQAHIRVPPFLPEDIEEYTENENERLSDPFEEEALDVITNAYIDNPRRIKHALNRLSTLRVLAEEIEETGELTEGRITENIPFLAKVSILEEEYPEFYDTLSENPRLLEDINDYFRDRLDDPRLEDRVQNALGSDSEKNGDQESRLESFLRSTRRIHVENPNPFLNLSEPSYATSLTDVDAFLQNLRTGQTEEVRKELDQAKEYDSYIDAIRNTVQEYTRKKRRQPLFGSIDTTISVFNEFDQQSQQRIIYLLGEYLTVDPGKTFLDDLDPDALFPIITRMKESDSEKILTEYTDLLTEDKDQSLRKNILKAFVDNAEDIPGKIATKVSTQIESLEENDPELKRALDSINSSEEARNQYIRSNTLKEAVSMIQLKESENEFINTNYYSRFDDIASQSAREGYILRLLELRQKYSSNQEQQIDQQFSNLLLDVKGDVTPSTGKEIFDDIREVIQDRGNQQPTNLVEVCFHFYGSFPEETQNEFHSWIEDLFRNWNVNNIEQLFNLSKEHDVPVAETGEEVEAILQQIPNRINNQKLIKNKIIPSIPEKYNEKVQDKVKDLINNDNHSQLGIQIFTEYTDRCESVWGEVIEICGNQANRQRNANQKRRYLEVGAEIFSKLDGPDREKYISQLDDLLNGNQNEYQLYQDLWNEIASEVNQDRKETVAEDIRNEIAQSFNRNQNPSHVDPLVEVLSTLTEYLTEENGQQFMNSISGRFTDNLNAGQKARVLQHISEFEEFFGKEDQILDRLVNLLDQTNHNNVTKNAEDLLDNFEDIGEVEQARIDQIRDDYLSE